MTYIRALRRLPQELLATLSIAVLIGCGGSGSSDQQSSLAITSLTPSYDFANGPLFTVTVKGSGFDSGSTIKINGAAHATTFVSNGQLTADLTSSDVAQPGTIGITVTTGNGQVSSSFPFQVMDSAKSPIHAASVKSDGTQDPIQSLQGGDPWISATGRYVAFTFYAPILGYEDSPAPLAFERDTCNSAPSDCQASTTLVSIYPDGRTVDDSFSLAGGISSDGRFVSFLTPFDIFLRDTCAGASQTCLPQTFPVLDTPGGPTIGNWFGAAFVSGNGRYVSFQWNPGDGKDTVYVTDTCAGVTSPCTPYTQEVAFGDDGVRVGGLDSALSADGRYVAFHGNLSTTIYVRDLCNGAPPGCSQQNVWSGDGSIMGDFGIRPMSPDARYLGFLGIDYQVYVQDTCIGAPGGCVPSTTLASIADDGSPANLQCGGVAITANGRYVAFGSYASDLVPGDTNYSDTNAGFDVFVHDTCIGADGGCTPHTVRVSLAADGSQADDAIDGYIVISGDGSYTAFSALADLVPGLMPASRNVFIVRNDAYMSGLDKTSSSNNIHK